MAILIVLTLAQTFVPFLPVAPLQEYRKPVPPPDVLGTIMNGDGRLASGINAWFDDQVGFRSILTRAANEIDYSLFGYSKKILIGNDGWLFDRNLLRVAIDQARSGNDVDVEIRRLDEVAAFLNRRNIRLIIISTSAKETFYADLLPAHSPRLPTITKLQKYRTALKERDGRDWLYIDSDDILKATRPDEPAAYFRTDPHLTAFSNYLVAKALLDKIASMEGTDWRWNPDLQLFPEKVDYGSDLRFLSVFSDVSEFALFPKLEAHYSPDRPPPGEFFVKPPPPPFELFFHNRRVEAKLPSTVLFGSSFLDWFVTLGAFSNFRDVYRMRGTSNAIGVALQAIPPGTRYFVYQFWEPDIGLLRQARIPQD
ncbi:MAG: hypothetical protein NTV97_35005 [Alphaproteobacteria bacterium]|nr:hypothetical protein [Alphaproteobacteria bacterium]